MKKADLVSACGIILEIRLSSRKIRRLLFNFLPDKSLTKNSADDCSHSWLASSPGRGTVYRSSVYLGGIQTLNNSGMETLEWLLREAFLLCYTFRYSRFSMASKYMVTTTSLVTRLKYKIEQDVLAHTALQQVDTIFSDALVATTRNMHG